MNIKGIYRSKETVEVFEEYIGGRLSDRCYDFYLFLEDGRVKNYSASDANPVNLDHKYWDFYTGYMSESAEQGLRIQLFNNSMTPTSTYSARVLDDQTIEIKSLKSGFSMLFEKVADLG